jgi:hypothetical protein
VNPKLSVDLVDINSWRVKTIMKRKGGSHVDKDCAGVASKSFADGMKIVY